MKIGIKCANTTITIISHHLTTNTTQKKHTSSALLCFQDNIKIVHRHKWIFCNLYSFWIPHRQARCRQMCLLEVEYFLSSFIHLFLFCGSPLLDHIFTYQVHISCIVFVIFASFNQIGLMSVYVCFIESIFQSTSASHFHIMCNKNKNHPILL